MQYLIIKYYKTYYNILLYKIIYRTKFNKKITFQDN